MFLPTVRIVSSVSDDNPLGYIVINEEDFDDKTMQLWSEPAPLDPVDPATWVPEPGTVATQPSPVDPDAGASTDKIAKAKAAKAAAAQ